MQQPRVAILVFPGTNSEEETRDACVDAGLDARLVLWSEPPSDLRLYDAYILPGGFAYEDRIRAGAVAAKSPSVAVVAEESRKGKLVLGLCNGAQVLAEAGLLGPVALARNLPSGRFQNQFVDVELAADPERCAFTRGLARDARLRMTLSHAEGRFCGDPDLFDRLEAQGRITFRYAGGAPNGAMRDAAAICNDEGNVLACMPHPERAGWIFNLAFADPTLRGADPLRPAGAHILFERMAAILRAA
ncbi:MAG: phosphoribosylformylglycinamidine synthase I [Candidatus Eremiobacteraeota bacterium]|nr:phosphoribosylformylglycinamidine synthase I [Candidatus Eremiobacteraeota bacterium]